MSESQPLIKRPHVNSNGGDFVADVLHAHKITHVFTLVGGHVSPILVACERLGIKVVDTRHEASACFAADAMARLTGRPGVAIVTAGPGITNTVTAIQNAAMAESPVVLIGGAAATLLKGRGALQDIDQMALLKPLCKYVATVTRVQDIVRVMRKALQEAMSGTPGPVFVECPIDTLYPEPTVASSMGLGSLSRPPRGFFAYLTHLYLRWYLYSLFRQAFARRYEYAPLPIHTPLSTDSQIRSAVKLLRNAKKPVLLVGSQAMISPTSAKDLQDAVTSLGIPTFLGGMARGLLGRSSPFQLKHVRKVALKEADVIIMAGMVCDFRLDYGRTLSRKAKIIAVNRNPKSLRQNADLFWSPTLTIQGDSADFIRRVAREVEGNFANRAYSSGASEFLTQLRKLDDEKHAKNLSKSHDVPAIGQLNPLRVLYDLEAHLPPDAILVADGGDFVGTAAYILSPRAPLHWLDPGAFGTLGVGGGFALGAKLARPDREVWILYGDGSVGYSLAEFDTYARHGVRVTAVVGNDGCWSQIAREQVPMFGTGVACGLEQSAYEGVVVALGGVGVRVEGEGEGVKVVVEDEPRGDEVLTTRAVAKVANAGEAFLRAREVGEKTGKSVLVNVLIGKSDFREGSISV
ncbi:thiamine pyrophosphate enzyme, N-terminal TPP binding domain-containing protein [Cladochytrium replicatum]|nr:thiamine pyrophosphate enzyme, N-terminal TPP binding domain-containing protein [Cladochytrium replicatum]